MLFVPGNYFDHVSETHGEECLPRHPLADEIKKIFTGPQP